MTDFYLIWTYNNIVQTGYVNNEYVNLPVYYNISYPDQQSNIIPVSLQTSAQVNSTFETIINVSFYLDGDTNDLEIVQNLWPSLGNSYNPPRPELSGGFEISFDSGNIFTRFDPGTGNKTLPQTWIPLPAIAMGSGSTAGQIGPYNIANMLVRYVIPPNPLDYKSFNISLVADFDII